MSALIEGAKKRLAQSGPDRVVVDINGQALSQFRAKQEFGVDADVVFIRADGWMLGAPWKLVNYARSIWKDQWVEEVIMNPDTRPKKAVVNPAYIEAGKGPHVDIPAPNETKSINVGPPPTTAPKKGGRPPGSKVVDGKVVMPAEPPPSEAKP